MSHYRHSHRLQSADERTGDKAGSRGPRPHCPPRERLQAACIPADANARILQARARCTIQCLALDSADCHHGRRLHFAGIEKRQEVTTSAGGRGLPSRSDRLSGKSRDPGRRGDLGPESAFVGLVNHDLPPPRPATQTPLRERSSLRPSSRAHPGRRLQRPDCLQILGGEWQPASRLCDEFVRRRVHTRPSPRAALI